LTMSSPRSKMSKTEDPGQDPHWQDVTIPTTWLYLWPIPYKRDPPRQISASHGKSPPRTASLRLARQVSSSHELSPTLWRPRFLISAISANGRISRVKPVDIGQT
jgi:hypothetical protein